MTSRELHLKTPEAGDQRFRRGDNGWNLQIYAAGGPWITLSDVVLSDEAIKALAQEPDEKVMRSLYDLHKDTDGSLVEYIQLKQWHWMATEALDGV